MQAVVHPLSLAAIGEQTGFAQQGQMTGNLGLDFIERTGEFAHAELLFARDQQCDARAGGVSEGFTEGIGGKVRHGIMVNLLRNTYGK